MGFFQEIDEQYFVEEISYDDMMLILNNQNHKGESENLQEQLNQCQEQPSEVEVAPAAVAPQQPAYKLSKADEVARRIAENANKKLPNWLLNH